MPDDQPKPEKLSQERKDADLRYLRKVLEREEREKSQVIPLPEEVAPLSPPVIAPIPVVSQEGPKRWAGGTRGIVLALVMGCLVIGAWFLFRFLTGDGLPTSGDFKLAGIGLLAIWFLTTLDAREERQREHFEAIERELAEIKRSLVSKRASGG
ncbi:MAG: hypothetical protein ABSE27_02710 [Acidobacteriaceae bacterium]|jgi:hypothetical protein